MIVFPMQEQIYLCWHHPVRGRHVNGSVRTESAKHHARGAQPCCMADILVHHQPAACNRPSA